MQLILTLAYQKKIYSGLFIIWSIFKETENFGQFLTELKKLRSIALFILQKKLFVFYFMSFKINKVINFELTKMPQKRSVAELKNKFQVFMKVKIICFFFQPCDTFTL